MPQHTARTPPHPRRPPRRTLLRLAATGLVAAGCGGGGGSGMAASWWGDPGLNEALNEAVDAFRAAGEGRPRVRSEFLPWDGYWDKLATRTAGGDAPDLMMQAATYLPEYVGRGALRPLDHYLTGELRLDGVDESARSTGRYRGRTYAVIAATNALTVIVNRDLLRETTGRDLPEDRSWTWDDLERLAEDVHRGSGGEVHGIQDAGGDLMAFQLFVRQRGRELFDEDDRPAFPADWLTEWLALWQRLRDSGAAPPPDMSAESIDMAAQSPMVRRRAAMTFGWTQDIASYASLLESEYGALLPPGPAPGAPGRARPGLWVNAASLWSVAAGTRHPDVAVALVDFLVNDRRAEERIGTLLGTPPRAEARARARGTADPVTRTGLDYMDRVARHSTPLPRVWPLGFTEARDEFNRYNQDVGFGLRSPEAAAGAYYDFAAGVVAA
ncbi:ABC transporter substrate-binding protein [Streptomyces johnsoniae]|uniref:Extracellular solute-binding protein n=1 Tax=Streptomyces johnsoniae TaxID=3075532 RepID=A0ABU2S2P8_9ACTN|nr:extracellular solute-binding protein [Streptomyces sp. DSM 41886]MDT0443058.1 extracellular solute-binding protein [Streptomyces sp. DSM 41886]